MKDAITKAKMGRVKDKGPFGCPANCELDNLQLGNLYFLHLFVFHCEN